MSFIEKYEIIEKPEGQIVAFYIPRNEMMMTYAMKMVEDEIVPRLVDEYVKAHGDEILKRINDKVIDAKVIAKVVERLRMELKESK